MTCIHCGGYHDTPRKNKNCELRRRLSSSPKVPGSTQLRFGNPVQYRYSGRVYRKW